jgi:hypothetical protein
MSDKQSISDELATGLGSIFSRVGEFFHLFDLSYIIAGTITFSALVFLYAKLGLAFPTWFPSGKWEGIAIIIVACYVCGLVSYAAGRSLSELLYRKKIGNTMEVILTAHGLQEEEQISKYSQTRKYEALYTRMWCEMAHEIPADKSKQQYFHNLIRYWSMSATYDGVAFAFFVWAIVLSCFSYYDKSNILNPSHAISFSAINVVAGMISLYRGYIYYKKQIEDIVAYYAMKHLPLMPINRVSECIEIND